MSKSSGRLRVMLVAGAICLTVAGCAPQAGYGPNNRTIWPFDTVWMPGARHPKFPHISASQTRDRWLADPGYQFQDGEGNLQVVWTPGVGRDDHPHIKASSTEGVWQPDPGYTMSADLNATWSPGQLHPGFPHIYAGPNEGRWRADLGYMFDDNDASLAVSWTPGFEYPATPHVVAFSEEGYWMAAPGYEFAGGYEVVPTAQVTAVAWTGSVQHPACPLLYSDGGKEGSWTIASNFELLSSDPSNVILRRRPLDRDEVVGRVITALFVGIIANSLAKPKDDDGLPQQVGRFFAGEVRNEAAKSLLQTISNAGPGKEVHCSLTSTDWTRDLRILKAG